MNLSLLQRPKKIAKDTKRVLVYHPSLVTNNQALVPGDPIQILDVFPGETTSETTLKVMKADDWGRHNVEAGHSDYRSVGDPCECDQELSEMDVNLREKIHYILLSDVGV